MIQVVQGVESLCGLTGALQDLYFADALRTLPVLCNALLGGVCGVFRCYLRTLGNKKGCIEFGRILAESALVLRYDDALLFLAPTTFDQLAKHVLVSLMFNAAMNVCVPNNRGLLY